MLKLTSFYLTDFLYFLKRNFQQGEEVATKSGREGQVQIRTFFVSFLSLMLLQCVNYLKHNINQNIYTGMEVISVIPP